MKGLIVVLGLVMAFVPGPAGQDDLIVHEWGTFTSVQDSKGVILEWKGINDWDLPNFVYTRKTNPDTNKLDPRGPDRNSKSQDSRVRMETPVIFFYGKKGLQVDVSVKFPQGILTEWYPRVRDMKPALNEDGVKIENGLLRWGKVTLLDPKDKEVKLPDEKDYKGHYLPSRDTDAKVVRVCAAEKDKNEYEKFLFYRGIGNFESPVSVQIKDEEICVKNNADYAVSDIFILNVKNGNVSVTHHDKLSAKDSISAKIVAPTTGIDSIDFKKFHEQLELSLKNQGLYKKEAKAFVETWKDSYVNTDGVRVLYVLPQKFTDKVLPLTVNPKPVKTVRVMVARVECITPEIVKQVEDAITQLGSDSSKERSAATELLTKLGRFAESALKVAVKETKDQEIKSSAEKILKALNSIQ